MSISTAEGRSGVDVFTFSVRDLFLLLRRYWLFILVFFCVCLLGGFLYIQSSPKQYSRYASLLIKNESSINSALAQLAQLTGEGGSYTEEVSNQMIILGTERLVSETVRRLDLDVEYKHRQGLRMVNLYKQSPVQIHFIDVDPKEEISLDVELVNADQGVFRLSSIESDVVGSVDQDIEAKLRDTLSTPIGKIVLVPTPYYSDVKGYESLKVKKQNFEETVQSYMQDLRVELEKKDASVIKLSLQSSNASLAEEFLAMLIQVYSEFERSDKVKIAESTQRFVDERLAIISSELGEVDAEIEDFKQSQQIADIATEAQQYIAGSSQMNSRLVDLNNNISVARFIVAHLRDKNHQNELIPANVGLSSTIVEGSIKDYNEMLLKRNQLLENSSDTNPVVEELSGQLAAQRLSIIKSIDNLIQSLEVERNGLQKERSSYQGQITSVPMKERIVGSIYRQQKIKEELYLFLLNVREQNALSIEAAESDARLIQAPTGPAAPVSPRTPIIMLASLMLGLLIPFALIYLRVITNNKVRGKIDVERVTQMPILGEVPHYHPSRKHMKQVAETLKLQMRGLSDKEQKTFVENSARLFIVGLHRRSATSEAFSVMRSNLSFMNSSGEPVKRIMITSAIPGSGKTFTSSNLALCLAQAGKKVLLLDCDIRKSTLSKGLGLHRADLPGLTSFLSNKNISVEDLLIPAEVNSNLTIIPSGPVPPNPTELLLSDRFELLLDQLSPRFDYIVVDSIPVINLADSRVVNHLMDATIMVVRENHLPRPLLAELDTMYREKRLRNLCVVLNDAGSSSSSYGYSYGYTYGSYTDEKE